MDGWMDGLKAFLRIAYSNQKRHFFNVGIPLPGMAFFFFISQHRFVCVDDCIILDLINTTTQRGVGILENILWLCTAIRDHHLPNTTIQVNRRVITHCTIAHNRASKVFLIVSITFQKIEMLLTDHALLFSPMEKDVLQMFLRVKEEMGMKVCAFFVCVTCLMLIVDHI